MPLSPSDARFRPVSLLTELNAQQLEAVQHGTGESAADTRPLLVIAGAGSGKTNTLAHRVANLIRHGADPQRMMLLTFSRRAAQEMERRVGGVLQQALGLPATQALPSLPWSRHLPQHRRAAAARIRGPHRPGGDLHHPRPRRRRRPDGHGAARHRPVGDEEPLSAQGHLPGHLLARAQHPRSAGAGAAGHLSLVQPVGERAEETVRRLCRSQAAAERAGLRRPAAVLGRDDGRARSWRRRSASASTTCWWTNTRTPTACSPRSSWR